MPGSLPLPIALVQLKPRKGDLAGNLARLPTVFAQIDKLDPRPRLVVFPETALTGYFLEGGVRDVAITAGAMADELHKAYTQATSSAGTQLDVIIGFYEVWENTLHNSALCVTVGGEQPIIRHVHRKMFLPTYGLFDEERFVERGHQIRAFELADNRVGMLVCEDAWHSLPGALAALDGAQLIVILAASPGRGLSPAGERARMPATLERWERLARDIAEEHGVFAVIAQLVGTEGGKTFPGGSVIVGPKGDVRASGPLWEEGIVTATLDFGDLSRARADMPLLNDLQTMLPHLLDNAERIRRGDPPELDYDVTPQLSSVTGDGAERRQRVGRTATKEVSESPPMGTASGPAATESLPVIPPSRGQAGPAPLAIDPVLTTDWLSAFIRDEVERRRFKRVIVALSGGVDSAVTTYLATRALGAENVIALRLPYRTSNPDSLSHAQLVIDALGIQAHTIDISPAVDAYLASEPDADATRRGNVMARLRMVALFDQSAKHNALPIGTGNKTERLFGYFTWHADDSPPINPLGDLFKTQVWELAQHLGVPDVIVGKAPSADLLQDQTDEADLGISYEKADQILNWLIFGYKPEEIVRCGFAAEEVSLVSKRLSSTHWKRKLPTVAMVSTAAIGESYLRPVDY
jgi:NAD+ synthase (glutamine-hydrolysing)